MRVMGIVALAVFGFLTTYSLANTGAGSVAATVNGVAISKSRLEREVKNLIPQAYYHAKVADAKKDELRKEALDNLINKELLAQEARKEGFFVPKRELDDAQDELAKSFGGKKNFEAALKNSGITYDEFKKELEKERLILKLYNKKIKFNITEDGLKEYYDKNKHKFKEPEKIKLSMIYIRNDPTDPKGKQNAKKQIDEAFAKIKANEKFGDVASKYSNAASRIKGGDMGYIHKGVLESTVVEKTAFAMKKGETSKIIDTDIGYFIVRVEDKISDRQLSFSDVKQNLKKELTEAREKERKSAMLDSLKKQAKIVK